MSAVIPTTAPQQHQHAPRLLSPKAWIAVATALFTVAIVVPTMSLALPATSPLHLSDYAVQLIAKIMCYAICALAMDLIWGYAGILSLGHGVFFALGGYAMGMYLMRQIGRDGNYQSDLPDFMVFLDWKTLPWHWALSDSFAATLALVVLVPQPVGLRVWLLCLLIAHQRRLLFHHHAGAHLRRDAAVFSQ